MLGEVLKISISMDTFYYSEWYYSCEMYLLLKVSSEGSYWKWRGFTKLAKLSYFIPQ